MSFQDNLELLSMANKFKIDKRDGNYYIESLNYGGIVAVIESGFFEVNYYVSGCYDSGTDLMSINIKELEEIRKNNSRFWNQQALPPVRVPALLSKSVQNNEFSIDKSRKKNIILVNLC